MPSGGACGILVPMSTESLPTLFHVINYADAEAGITFLRSLGFEEVWTVRDDHGRVQHAELRWSYGAGAVMLGQADTDAFASVGQARAYVVAPAATDLSALLATTLDEGAKLVRSLDTGPGGGQVFAIADPEGNEWEIGHYAGGGA